MSICERCGKEFPRSKLTVYDVIDDNPWPDDVLLCPSCANVYYYEYRVQKLPESQTTFI